MKQLFQKVEHLKNSRVKNIIDIKLKQFKDLGKGTNKEIFKELCFCILTANFNAKRSIEIQMKIGDKFLDIPESKLTEKLRQLGHRYPNARAEYIVNARKYKNSIKDIVMKFPDEKKLREWLVKNVKGLGYKEASHFLRNIGYENLAIIDFHIIDILVRHNVIKKPKTLSKRKYLEIENSLKKIAAILKMNLAELDLYLWYMETGKILK
ncbi:MAG: N-glycosylase/DNA lyase [Candidatus Bathyarchaeota archaeon]|jgi:N-glycosylase/DNA lyase